MTSVKPTKHDDSMNAVEYGYIGHFVSMHVNLYLRVHVRMYLYVYTGVLVDFFDATD